MRMDLLVIVEYLKEKKGVDFAGCHPPMIERRLGRRLFHTKCQDYPAYLQLLRNDPRELDRLLDALTIKVSKFFRDPLTFEYLAKSFLPSLLARKEMNGDRSLRVWSAGCCRGEEAYSLAILFHELFGKKVPEWRLHLFATDLDRGGLRTAREGLYDFAGVENVKFGLLRKYFTAEGDCFRLVPEIRERVGFSVYDLLDPRNTAPPDSVFGDFDLVLCRNVLIYFRKEYQNRILEKLHRSLADGGYLLLGEAEVPTEAYQSELRLIDDCGRIYQKKAASRNAGRQGAELGDGRGGIKR
jgi:chemotaxis protein methyltransferase CheR